MALKGHHLMSQWLHALEKEVYVLSATLEAKPAMQSSSW